MKDKPKVNCCEDYEVKKWKQMLRKEKNFNKKEFLEENENKFDTYSEDDTDCDSYTNFESRSWQIVYLWRICNIQCDEKKVETRYLQWQSYKDKFFFKRQILDSKYLF